MEGARGDEVELERAEVREGDIELERKAYWFFLYKRHTLITFPRKFKLHACRTSTCAELLDSDTHCNRNTKSKIPPFPW